MTATCSGCEFRVANGQDLVCDGSGIIAVSEWPAEKSYVVVCPEFDCDSEPDGIWEATNWLDPGPEPSPELRTAVMTAVREEGWAHRHIVAPDSVNCEPLDEPQTFLSADYLAHVDRVRNAFAIALVVLGMTAAVFITRWVWTR